MCTLDTEGTKCGCGHYVITREVRKNDCNSVYCRLSARHPPNCTSSDCNQFYGPDRSETITVTTPDYCQSCHWWYKEKNIRR